MARDRMVFVSYFLPIVFASIKEVLLEKVEGNTKESNDNTTAVPSGNTMDFSSSWRGFVRDEFSDIISIDIVEGLEFRVALSDESKLWENASVPYQISSDYTSTSGTLCMLAIIIYALNNGDKDRKIIMLAMQDFRNRTCVRFRRRKDEQSYISLKPGKGCLASVGKTKTVNRVSLGDNCLVKGVVIHELMHTLGFFHEHTRPDRDKYVRINFDNIISGAENNFAKMPANEVSTFNQSYDYGSVLHYGKFDFAKDKNKPTIVPLKEGVEIGQREGFSDLDVVKINLLYNCSQRNETGNDAQSDFVAEEADEDTEQEKKKRAERRRWMRFLFWLFRV